MFIMFPVLRIAQLNKFSIKSGFNSDDPVKSRQNSANKFNKLDNSGERVEKITSNKDLAELIFSAMNTRDLAELENNLAENAVFDFPGAGCLKGRKRILVFLKILFRKYSQLEFCITEIIQEGDRVCVLWTNAGKSSKGSPYNNRGVTIVHLAGGRIVYISDYFKDTSFVEAG